jgi:hypothetical protein
MSADTMLDAVGLLLLLCVLGPSVLLCAIWLFLLTYDRR